MAAEAVGHLGRYAQVFPIGEPRHRLYRGLLAWTAGRPAAARRDWQAALAAAERLGMRYDRPWPWTPWAGTGSPGSAPPSGSGPWPCSSGWGSRT